MVNAIQTDFLKMLVYNARDVTATSLGLSAPIGYHRSDKNSTVFL